MAKFNTATAKEKETTNYMGAPAVKLNPELELVSLLLSSFASDSYYEKESDTFKRLASLVEANDKEFVAKAAIYARTVFGMRSISHICASELAKYISGKEWAKHFYNKVIHRPDDMLEIAAYHTKHNGKISKAMSNGFALAIGRFSEYELAKYRGENKTFKMIDIVNLVHPVPQEKNKEALAKLVKDELRSVDTWESELTQAGQKASSEEEKVEFKKEVWTSLLNEGKIGIFAVLRNLRNIIEQAPDALPKALEILTDEKRIKKSLILPFRYLTAYTEIEKLDGGKKVFEKDGANHDTVLKAIEKAILISIQNLPTLMGKTIILSDNSGSMRGDYGGHSLVSVMSNTKTSDIANLFALMYWLKADNTMVGLFGDRLLYPQLDRSKGLFENFKVVYSTASKCGGATEYGIFEMFKRLINEKIIADTIVIFSDCQIGAGCKWYGPKEHAADFGKLFSEYKKINPNFRCYSIDLKGYGTTVFDGSVVKISGWSEKIFDIMKFAEQDKNALVNEIRKIALN